MADAALVLQIAGASGIAAVLTTVIQGIFARRRLGAEATQIIQKAASGVVRSMEAEDRRKEAKILACEAKIRSQDDRIALLEAREDDLEEQIQEARMANQLHASWDFAANIELRAMGSKLPEPPPLYPPPKSRVAPR